MGTTAGIIKKKILKENKDCSRELNVVKDKKK